MRGDTSPLSFSRIRRPAERFDPADQLLPGVGHEQQAGTIGRKRELRKQREDGVVPFPARFAQQR